MSPGLQAMIAARRARPLVPLVDRFWGLVDKEGPTVRSELGRCWKWTGATGSFGHAVLGRGRRGEGLVRGSHVSWEIHRGPVPEGMKLLHRCDNPPCCNPAHLFLGSDADNIADKLSKGRQARGESNNAKLREADVIAIRRSPLPHREIAAAFKVSAALVGLIRQRKRWGHVA